MKDEYRINIRATKKDKNELRKVAKVTGIPQSVIVREAIAEKIADLMARAERGEKFEVGVVAR